MLRSRALLVLLAAAALLAPVATADAHAATVPATRAAVTRLHGQPVRPAVRLDFLAARWRGREDGAKVRLHRHGGWGAWRPLRHGDVQARGMASSELIATGGADAYQIRLPRGARDARATAIDTTTGPRRAVAARSALPTPLVRQGICYRSRAAWGADESLRFRSDGSETWPPAYFPVQRLTLHHTAGEAVGDDPAAYVRAIYRLHAIDNGWGDIGYQLLIDDQGCVYEGRWSGDDGLPVFGPPAADGTPQAVNGAHVVGYNAGNVGIALLGDFTDHAPSSRAQRAVTFVLAALSRIDGLDPLATGTYENPITHVTKDVPTISGHRDWLPTLCPGDQFYALLPALRERVAALLQRLPSI